MTTSPLAQRVLAEYSEAGVTDPSRLQRIGAALGPGLPTAREENWKYANLRALERLRYRPTDALEEACIEYARRQLPPLLPGMPRVVFVDGRFAPQLSSGNLPAGVAATQSGTPTSASAPVAPPTRTVFTAAVAGAAMIPPPSVVPDADLRFAAINHALGIEELHVDVPQDASVALDVVFVASTAGSRHASYPVLRARTGSGSRLTLVERHIGGLDGSFSNARVLVDAGPAARVAHTRLHSLAERAHHVETLEVSLGEGAELAVVAVTTGAATLRSTVIGRHAGRDSTLRWHAVSLATGNQSHDAAIRIEHDARGARTEQLFRGIASGRGRVSFNGHMVVQASAPGADSAQSLKCLTDGPDAEANLRPQLEIHTDAVRATHGATVGKLDETMRFYLLSRGIDPATAAALLKWAFVEDVVSRIDPPALRTEVERGLAGVLGDAVVAELIS